MNENPPSIPPKPPQPASVKSTDPEFSPSLRPWQTTCLGALLFVVTVAMSFAFPPMCLLGLAAAIGSLFFKGYRLIFAGYIGTVGLILLGLIIYCSNHPFEDR